MARSTHGRPALALLVVLVGACGLPAGAAAGVAWSSPVVVARGAQLDSVAGSLAGTLAFAYTVPAGPGDFSGAPTGSAGLDLVVAGSDGSVSPVAQLTQSATARGSVTAVGRGGDVVVAWTDRASPGVIWAAVRSGSGATTPAQPVAVGAWQYSSPAVAADDRGDVAVAWVDDATRGVFVTFRPAGGAFGPAVSASPEEGSGGHPALAMDAAGRTTVAWQATWPGAIPYVTATPPPAPPGLVMAATAPFGGPFARPRIALANPAGATPGAAGTGQVGSASAGDLALTADAAGHLLVSGAVGISQLPFPLPGPAAGLVYAVADGDGAFAAEVPVAGLTASSNSPARWAFGRDQILGAYGGVGDGESALETTLLGPGSALRSDTPYAYAPIGGVTNSSIADGFDASGDAIVPFTADHTMSSGTFANGNFSGGSILSVARPADRGAWCPPQVISGLMSPYFPIAVSFDSAGGGIVGFQQTPKDELAVSYLQPIAAGCAPASTPATGASAPVAFPSSPAVADPLLRLATIQATCTTTSRCRGTLSLLDGRSRPLATGGLSVPGRHTKTLRLRLTARGRADLRRRDRIEVRPVIARGGRSSRQPNTIFLQR